MSSLNIEKLNYHSHNTCYSPNPPSFNIHFLHLLHYSSQKHENHPLSFPVTRCLGLLGAEGAPREAGLSVLKQKSSRIQQQLVTLPVPHSVYPNHHQVPTILSPKYILDSSTSLHSCSHSFSPSHQASFMLTAAMAAQWICSNLFNLFSPEHPE